MSGCYFEVFVIQAERTEQTECVKWEWQSLMRSGPGAFESARAQRKLLQKYAQTLEAKCGKRKQAMKRADLEKE